MNTAAIPTHETGSEHYLCVDLDGTLVLTDTFGEALLRFLRRSPLRFPHLLLWSLRGRAFLKMKVCEATSFAPENLPYNSALLAYIKDQKATGSLIILATGAHQSFAAQVAEHLDLFDDVLSSDGRQNLVGANKARLLAAKYPGGFQYAGNSRADIPVWKQSGGAIVVSDSARLKRILQRNSIPIIQVISAKRGGPFTWMRAIRVHQWVKNLLVLLPVLTSHRLAHWPTLRAGLISMVAFSFAASAIYIINDLLDIPDDRLHARYLTAGASPLPFLKDRKEYPPRQSCQVWLRSLPRQPGQCSGARLAAANYRGSRWQCDGL